MEGSNVVQRRTVVGSPVHSTSASQVSHANAGFSATELEGMAKTARAAENTAKRRVMAVCHCNASSVPHYHTDTEGIVNA